MTPSCLNCKLKTKTSSEARTTVVRYGSFTRKSDQAIIQRFRCQRCLKGFSQATFSDCYRQKKRPMNAHVFRLLVGGFSQRRTAFELGLNRKTVVRKLILMGIHAQQVLYKLNQCYSKSTTIEFDDLETFEHSKCKPLSVIMAVEHKTRRILGFQVSSMSAKGKLAHIARKKYGHRKDERKLGRKKLFIDLKTLAEEFVILKSDESPHYPQDVRRFFPNSSHQTFKGRRGCVVGQGELKCGGFDPLFSLNHTFAMLRANINRLFRRTWNTTKKKERLGYHIALYALYHNMVLI